MKKEILYILPLMLMTLVLTSCDKDEIKEQSVITADSYQMNEFDKWLEANYVNPYNISFKYRYEEIESDYNYYTIPAQQEDAIIMAHLVKYLCVETYNEVAGINFTRAYFPKMFYLIGTWEFRNNGSYILGTAEGGRKILLAGINELSSHLGSADELNYYYIKTIHHEFTHILNQTRDYPTSFAQVTPSSYVSDSQFSEPYLSNYLARGFISAYAQTEPREDFAEMVSEYVTHTPEWWEAQMLAADITWDGDTNQSQTGRVFIEQKLDIVRAYMNDTWGIDMDKLRDCILRRQDNVARGFVNLTDLTVD
jgi:substrate import-associated zinc metallohydrolase lipoprotein